GCTVRLTERHGTKFRFLPLTNYRISFWVKRIKRVHFRAVSIDEIDIAHKPSITQSGTPPLNSFRIIFLITADEIPNVEHIQHILIQIPVKLMLQELLKTHQLSGMIAANTFVKKRGARILKRTCGQVQYPVRQVLIEMNKLIHLSLGNRPIIYTSIDKRVGI